MIPQLDIDCICILTESVWEWEIRKKIYHENLFELSKIISIHEIFMMDFFGMDAEACYRKILKMTHPRQLGTGDMWRVYEYFKKSYSYILCDSSYWKKSHERKIHIDKNRKPIWVLWLQGFEQAPDLVKVCVHSLQKVLGKQERLYLLDQNNVFDYIDLPDYIIRKWQKGNISNTHFSDLIRLSLLNTYGGVWIDATVYFTGNQQLDFIKSQKLFMFSIWSDWRTARVPAVSANWLISALPGNKLLMIMEALLQEYWKREDRAIRYGIFHIFWTMVAECCSKEWDEVEVILRNPSWLLGKKLTCKFEHKCFARLKRMTDIHKLTYKTAYAEGGDDTFWAKICEIEKRGEKNEKAYYDIGNA